jgi:hypothetical protein
MPDHCSGLGEEVVITHRVTETKPTPSSIGLQRDSGSHDSLSQEILTYERTAPTLGLNQC